MKGLKFTKKEDEAVCEAWLQVTANRDEAKKSENTAAVPDETEELLRYFIPFNDGNPNNRSGFDLQGRISRLKEVWKAFDKSTKHLSTQDKISSVKDPLISLTKNPVDERLQMFTRYIHCFYILSGKAPFILSKHDWFRVVNDAPSDATVDSLKTSQDKTENIASNSQIVAKSSNTRLSPSAVKIFEALKKLPASVPPKRTKVLPDNIHRITMYPLPSQKGLDFGLQPASKKTQENIRVPKALKASTDTEKKKQVVSDMPVHHSAINSTNALVGPQSHDIAIPAGESTSKHREPISSGGDMEMVPFSMVKDSDLQLVAPRFDIRAFSQSKASVPVSTATTSRGSIIAPSPSKPTSASSSNEGKAVADLPGVSSNKMAQALPSAVASLKPAETPRAPLSSKCISVETVASGQITVRPLYKPISRDPNLASTSAIRQQTPVVVNGTSLASNATAGTQQDPSDSISAPASNNSSEQASTKIEKKRVGRPPKRFEHSPEAAKASNDTTEEAVPKKKRGRPPVKRKDTEDDDDFSMSPNAKRRLTGTRKRVSGDIDNPVVFGLENHGSKDSTKKQRVQSTNEVGSSSTAVAQAGQAKTKETENAKKLDHFISIMSSEIRNSLTAALSPVVTRLKRLEESMAELSECVASSSFAPHGPSREKAEEFFNDYFGKCDESN